MKVVAEGVESQEQCEILKQYNCDILQGWLFSKALPLGELIEFLNKKEIAWWVQSGHMLDLKPS